MAVAPGQTLAALLEELELDPRWVVAEYNGEPVALTPHTRNNVARLVLGQ